MLGPTVARVVHELWDASVPISLREGCQVTALELQSGGCAGGGEMVWSWGGGGCNLSNILEKTKRPVCVGGYSAGENAGKGENKRQGSLQRAEQCCVTGVS